MAAHDDNDDISWLFGGPDTLKIGECVMGREEKKQCCVLVKRRAGATTAAALGLQMLFHQNRNKQAVYCGFSIAAVDEVKAMFNTWADTFVMTDRDLLVEEKKITVTGHDEQGDFTNTLYLSHNQDINMPEDVADVLVIDSELNDNLTATLQTYRQAQDKQPRIVVIDQSGKTEGNAAVNGMRVFDFVHAPAN
jgi:hypothetical protein